MDNLVFDALYWAFGGVMLLALVATMARSTADVRHGSGYRSLAEATLVAAVGAMLALVAGFGLNALRSVTGDLFYQQAHFIAFYLAFGLVLWAFDRVGMTGIRTSRSGRVLRTIAWGVFALATLVAIGGLLTPEGYRVVSHGDVRYIQQPAFFLPAFVALAVGAAWLPSWVSADQRQTARPWLAAFAAFMLVGMLREATIIPSTDETLIDLLLAFVPFTVAVLCLYRAASVGSVRVRVSQGAAMVGTEVDPRTPPRPASRPTDHVSRSGQ